MGDLISRQAAITLPIMPKEYRKHKPIDCDDAYEQGWGDCQSCIELLPTAEKKGEWIPVVDGNYIIWECSECHVESEAWTDYCPICGSRNIEEMDEEAFEEILEEFRKDPKTYTLDEVETELGLTAEKKGEWIKGTGENGVNTSLYCDQCGYENGHWYEWNYCPNCGARMEESE